jgi:ABC-type multidrug transport system fused ATPase/permease subunit
MERELKHTFVGYFRFFYKVLGKRLVLDMFQSILVSFLDGVGLAMFIPLLQSMGNAETNGSGTKNSMGNMHFFTDIFGYLNIPLNIYSALIALAILFVLKGILKFIQQNSQVSLKQSFIKKLRYELTNDLQHLSYTGFLKQDAGKIQNIVTSEIQKLNLALTNYLTSVSGIAMLLTYVAMAFLANWQFAFLVAVGSVLSNLIFRGIVRSIKTASVKISAIGNTFNSHILEAVHYFKYLKATNQFRGFSKKIRSVIDSTEQLNKKIGYYQAITSSIREPLVMVIVVVVIIIQVKWMGGNLSSIILSLLLFYRALSYLMNFQTSWQNFLQNVGAIQSVSSLSEEMKANKEVQSDRPFTGFNTGISIENLFFKYGDNLVLKDLDLDIPKNQTIALVGESGSGKTTLANIITGILPMANGRFLMDGRPLNDYNLDSYRSRIGYISQEAVIFKDDVFNNITIWAEKTKENVKRFWEVVEMASLNEFVDSLPEKEFTSLGDKGMLISGGQRQRISIARELYKDADILILDEATSALDSETELFIQKNIEKLQGNYTMIIIAHRLSTIKKADRIYMLENGEVSCSGTFDELVELSTRFKRMVSLQQI